LSNVIEVKRNNYNNQIPRSTNKIKTTLEIVKVESGKMTDNNYNINIQEMNVDVDSTDNPRIIASLMNNSLAEKTLSRDKNTATITTTTNNNNGISHINNKHNSTIK
jgi:hypothetical protein